MPGGVDPPDASSKHKAATPTRLCSGQLHSPIDFEATVATTQARVLRDRSPLPHRGVLRNLDPPEIRRRAEVILIRTPSGDCRHCQPQHPGSTCSRSAIRQLRARGLRRHAPAEAHAQAARCLSPRQFPFSGRRTWFCYGYKCAIAKICRGGRSWRCTSIAGHELTDGRPLLTYSMVAFGDGGHAAAMARGRRRDGYTSAPSDDIPLCSSS